MAVFSRGNVKSSKLTPTQVYEMRRRYEQGWSQGRLSREYGVSVGQIGRIVRGESWQSYGKPDSREELEELRLEAAKMDDAPLSEAEAKAIEESQRKLMELLK